MRATSSAGCGRERLPLPNGFGLGIYLRLGVTSPGGSTCFVATWSNEESPRDPQDPVFARTRFPITENSPGPPAAAHMEELSPLTQSNKWSCVKACGSHERGHMVQEGGDASSSWIPTSITVPNASTQEAFFTIARKFLHSKIGFLLVYALISS